MALIKTFAVGFLYDTVAWSYLMVPLVLYCALVPERFFATPLQRYMLYGITAGAILLFVFIAVAEHFYWEEFQSRFDFVAVDYLVYRREVMDNIDQSYPLGGILLFIGCISSLLFATIKKFIDSVIMHYHVCRRRFLTAISLLLMPCASFFFISDSLSHITENELNNNLALNGIYCFFQALNRQQLNYAQHYATLPESLVALELHRAVATKNDKFLNPNFGTGDIRRKLIPARHSELRPNVVVVVLESMSAKFMDTFGGQQHLTPTLDALALQGMLFTNLYATGTRTVRGLEALSLSVPPAPPASVLKRPHNGNLFTIGTPFQQRGYETIFFYGGLSYFDHMKTFYRANGFRVIDRTDLSGNEITFANAWGVCDEDIYRRVVREADVAQGSGENFFFMVMTTSNHRPFTYPEGKIDIPSGTGRKGAVKYADYAVGQFLKDAATKSWFANTVFIFIADHCARSGGPDAIPIDNYLIPCILYAPKIIPPRKVDTLASQIDVAPTLFDLLNWNYTSSFVGTSILAQAPDHQRAFLSNHLTLGYLRENMVIALTPGRQVKAYRVDPLTHNEIITAPIEPYVTEAITYYQGTSKLLEALLVPHRALTATQQMDMD
ncbi:MAG: sulfatase-like hydrolase/transferase [Desulfobacterota bacterium]|nr:sulfatase-like hydrolase/transferase [Thermodesulfobacteriota bacterium]